MQRFYSKKWESLLFANENSKYHSLLILCKYLKPNQDKDINNILEIIIMHLKEMNFEIQKQNQIEKLLLCLLFLGIRVEKELKEKIIKHIEEYINYLKNKINDGDIQLIGNILSLSENILYYLVEHKNDSPIILDSKKVDQRILSILYIKKIRVLDRFYVGFFVILINPLKIFSYNNIILLVLLKKKK